MAIDQVVLARMIAGATKDLTGATESLDGLNNQITIFTEDDTLYKAMMDQAKTDLETILAGKVISIPNTTTAWQAGHVYAAGSVVRPTTANGFVYYTSLGGTSAGAEPVWPIIAGGTVMDNTVEWECESLSISYGTTYGGINISDWKIEMSPASVSIYQYSNDIETIKSFTVSGDFTGDMTVRNIVSGFTQNCDYIRIGIQGNSVGITTISNVSIAERDGVTQDIIDATQKFFLFSGGSSISINPGEIEYSDFLAYAFDASKTYMITMYFNGQVGAYNGAGNSYYRYGDYSLEADWGTSGTGLGQQRSIEVLQGFVSGTGQGWDGDTNIIKWVTDYGYTYPLIYNNPYGTYYMLKALNGAKPLVQTKKTLITNRNPILSHYVV